MMSEGSDDSLQLSEDALLLQQNGNTTQCVTKLKLLQRRLMQIDRWQLSGSVLSNLCSIILSEKAKWSEDGEISHPSVTSLEVMSCCLCCLRNSTPNCARNQLLIAEAKDNLEPIASSLYWILETGKSSVIDERTDYTREEEKGKDNSKGFERDEGNAQNSEWLEAYVTLAFSCITCLGNLVAANSTTRRIVWPRFVPVLENILEFRDKEVSQASTMILHNCLLEDELKQYICKYPRSKNVLSRLLTLYESETKYSCFVLLCVEVLLTTEGLLERVWASITEAHKRLCLEILEAGLTRSSSPLSKPQGNATLGFLVGVFKSQADTILRTHTDCLDPDSALVLVKIMNFVCGVAASDTWRLTLQRDKSLLVTSVALLQCMSEIGKMEGNAFTPLDRFSDLSDVELMTQAEGHPAFGFKCDLIRLIANLVHRNLENQDLVREMDGLLLVLESSKFDARNPLIKEASIFAIRNLLEGNAENQKCIKELRMTGVAQNPGLAEIGMEALEEDGKIKIVQKSELPIGGDNPPPPEL